MRRWLFWRHLSDFSQRPTNQPNGEFQQLYLRVRQERQIQRHSGGVTWLWMRNASLWQGSGL